MKVVVSFALAVLALASAGAQTTRRPGLVGMGRHERPDDSRAFRPSVHHRHGRGSDQARHRHWYVPHYSYPIRGFGDAYPYRYGYFYGSGYPYGFDYGYAAWPSAGWSGSAAANGFWLGALGGGIIGHNSGAFGHRAWRGAAWGAGLGWVLGTVADADRRILVHRPPMVQLQRSDAPLVQRVSAGDAPRPPVTVTTNHPVNRSPMAAANAMFGRD